MARDDSPSYDAPQGGAPRRPAGERVVWVFWSALFALVVVALGALVAWVTVLNHRNPAAATQPGRPLSAQAPGRGGTSGTAAVAGAETVDGAGTAADVLPQDFLDGFRPHGLLFGRTPMDAAQPPQAEPLVPPSFPGNSAIWGALGRDHRGHLWFGVSTRGQGPARLLEFIPEDGRFIDRGDPVAHLQRLGLHQPGDTQHKIHSRIVQAEDSYLYFTSMDEQGESADGDQLRNPTFGSHLWRLRPGQDAWEHVLAAPEGLIALDCAGRYVYALGYWGHVLYQYDRRSGKTRSVPVGSVAGHVSRNFFADTRDHVFVPRCRPGGGPDEPPTAELAEFDANLDLVGSTPLEGYFWTGRPAGESHGMTAFQPLADGSTVFVTHPGRVYRVTPPRNLPPSATPEPAPATAVAPRPASSGGPAAAVTLLASLPVAAPHLAVESLFTFDGLNQVVAVTTNLQWMCLDLDTREVTLQPLAVAYPDGRKVDKHLPYGCIVRDARGRFYVVGTDQHRDRPVILRLSPR